MSAIRSIARSRCDVGPTIRETVIPCRWAHSVISVDHTRSATSRGPTTSVRLTSNRPRRISRAVWVMGVFPVPTSPQMTRPVPSVRNRTARCCSSVKSSKCFTGTQNPHKIFPAVNPNREATRLAYRCKLFVLKLRRFFPKVLELNKYNTPSSYKNTVREAASAGSFEFPDVPPATSTPSHSGIFELGFGLIDLISGSVFQHGIRSPVGNQAPTLRRRTSIPSLLLQTRSRRALP